MMAKVATDQLVMAPLFNPLFVTALFPMEGRPAEAWPAIKDIYVDMMLSNYKLWPAAQAVNFFFVPVQFQVLASNFIDLANNGFYDGLLVHRVDPDRMVWFGCPYAKVDLAHEMVGKGLPPAGAFQNLWTGDFEKRVEPYV